MKPAGQVVFNTPTNQHKTVLLMGMARSGTSMLAAVLDALGVNMGGNGIDGHYEREEFKWDFDKGIDRWRTTCSEIERLNDEHKIWGSKIRLTGPWTDKIIKQVEKPCLIIIFRDLSAILSRHISQPDHRTVPQLMEWMIRQQQMIWNVARTTELPVMLVSCEKLRYDSMKTIDAINAFLMIGGNRNEAFQRISKKGGYLVQSV